MQNNRISLKGVGKQWVFGDNCSKNISEWTEIIEKCISLTKCEISNVSSEIIKEPLYWKALIMAESKFRRNAAPGDIILFRGKTMMNKVQRLFTNSKFDHVALLLRDKKGRLKLMEATGTDGVTCTYWASFLEKGFNNEFDQIVYRHLNCNRDPETLTKLNQFAKVKFKEITAK